MNLLARLLRRVFEFLADPHETWAQQWLMRRAEARVLQQFRTSGKRRKVRPCLPQVWPVRVGRCHPAARRRTRRL